MALQHLGGVFLDGPTPPLPPAVLSAGWLRLRPEEAAGHLAEDADGLGQDRSGLLA